MCRALSGVIWHNFPIFISMFYRLLSNSEYPRLWDEVMIVPIFKGGNPNEAGDYRGITLINIFQSHFFS